MTDVECQDALKYKLWSCGDCSNISLVHIAVRGKGRTVIRVRVKLSVGALEG